MSNVGIFFVSPTQEQALDYIGGGGDTEPGLLLTLDYSCALFWLAAFATTDELRVKLESSWVDEADAEDFSVYVTDIAKGIERLRSRKAAVLAVLPEAVSAIYASYYEQWIGLLARHSGYIALNPIEVVGLGEQTEAEALLRRAIKILGEVPETEVGAAWQALNPKAVVMPFDLNFRYENAQATAILWRNILAGGDGAAWPSSPNEEELRVAAPPNVSPLARLIAWLRSTIGRWFGAS